MDIADALATRQVNDVDLDPYADVEEDASVCEAVAAMNAVGATCAVVMSDEGPAGMFTERDIVQRVLAHDHWHDNPISEFMSPAILGLPPSGTVLDAVQLMNEQHFRHVLVIETTGEASGVVSDTALIKLVDSLLRAPSVRDEHQFAAQHGLLFVDFTGLSTAKPVTVAPTSSLAEAVREMRSRAIGSVLVVDDRQTLVGVFTERDIQERVLCVVDDLETASLEDFMTGDPVALEPRATIAEGFSVMARHGFTHLPLVAESGRPVGVASFRDLADYLEISVSAVN